MKPLTLVYSTCPLATDDTYMCRADNGANCFISADISALEVLRNRALQIDIYLLTYFINCTSVVVMSGCSGYFSKETSADCDL